VPRAARVGIWSAVREDLEQVRSLLGFSTVSISLPVLGISELKVDRLRPDRALAWNLYVELNTRGATQELGEDEGLLRENMDSLYTLYRATREALKAAGPPNEGADLRLFHKVGFEVLNGRLRGFLAKWHPRLKAVQDLHPGKSQASIEAEWADAKVCRAELVELRAELRGYADRVLAVAKGTHARDLGGP
jgi:hypothetical protein